MFIPPEQVPLVEHGGPGNSPLAGAVLLPHREDAATLPAGLTALRGAET
jgi:hypothetical protein